jgi:DMSO reductase family type II enzyme chaperone
MNEEILEPLKSPEERDAAARSRAFRVFAAAFEYPDEDLLAAIGSGELAQGLRRVLEAVDADLAAEAGRGALAQAGEGDALAVEYTRLFEVGVAGPPCPLYGGLYGGDRMKAMEEVVRFYNHFGLTLSDTRRELPDHLTTELEFLHFLAFREVEALQAGGDVGPWRRAQRDFVHRHPGRWVPKLRERLSRHDPMPFYAQLVNLLHRFLEKEGARLEAQAGSPPNAS